MAETRNFVAVVAFSFLVASGIPVASADSGRFGVLIGGQGRVPGIAEILKELGVGWVRINNHLDGKGGDIARFLEAGFDVVITFDNHDPDNIDTAYGPPREFPNAGYPFRSKKLYQQRIREVIKPLLPYLAAGRRIMVQCENEIGDASINRKARYWRGTTDQYLAHLQALYEEVRSIDPSIPVVLSSFTSEGLSQVVETNQSDPRVRYANKLMTTLLTKGSYDVVDLHFYGCVDDIPRKVRWAKFHMPAGRRWISTENGGPDTRCGATPVSYDKEPGRYERLQAEQVPQRLSACADNSGEVCLWFSLLDMRGETAVFTHMGLLEISSGSQQKTSRALNKGLAGGDGGKLTAEQKEKFMRLLRKKPAYEAFKAFVAGHR